MARPVSWGSGQARGWATPCHVATTVLHVLSEISIIRHRETTAPRTVIVPPSFKVTDPTERVSVGFRMLTPAWNTFTSWHPSSNFLSSAAAQANQHHMQNGWLIRVRSNQQWGSHRDFHLNGSDRSGNSICNESMLHINGVMTFHDAVVESLKVYRHVCSTQNES